MGNAKVPENSSLCHNFYGNIIDTLLLGLARLRDIENFSWHRFLIALFSISPSFEVCLKRWSDGVSFLTKEAKKLCFT